MASLYYTFIFKNGNNSTLINVKSGTTIQELINKYFKRMQKANLIIDNISMIYFHYNGKEIKYQNNTEKVESYFLINLAKIFVERLDSQNSFRDYEIIEDIKKNVYTSVHKARIKNKNYPVDMVAIKLIHKDILKEEIKLNLMVDKITEEDFIPQIVKFNKEIKNMEKCQCENSVEIYDYFDTEKDFVIIMELCDDTLIHELAKTNSGFNVEEIKDILLQLNNVFKRMHEYKISHRDIKLNNILIKYLNEEKTKFKILLSDYGISNQLSQMTTKYQTYAGTQIIMAPEILSGEKYNDKCDLWFLGVIIYQLKTKKLPYVGKFDKLILKEIDKLGQTVLDIIDDTKLKDLLSKLLVKDPNKRISWDEYFEHSFFK